MTSILSTSLFESTGYGGIVELLDEVHHAPCFDADPEIFFAEGPAELEAAKVICQDCPVKRMCLAGALNRHEPYGVWGGQLVLNGAVVARKRPRGRPRKAEAARPHGEMPDPLATHLGPRGGGEIESSGTVHPSTEEAA